MNRYLIFSTLLVLALANACKKNPPSSGAALLDANAEIDSVGLQYDGGPESISEIADYVDTLDVLLPILNIRGPVPVTIGKDILADAKIYSDTITGDPLVIYCQIRDVEQWYYLFARRVVHFRERQPASRGFEERRWDYTYKAAVRGEQRNAATPDGLSSAEPEELKLGDMRPRETHGNVNTAAFEIIYGKILQ